MLKNLDRKIIAIIVAGGKGERLNAQIPKQYLEIKGKTLLRRTIDNFFASGIDNIQIVIGENDQKLYQNATKGLNLLPPVIGGVTRQESVLNGLKAIKPQNPDYVLIHDAARIFADEKIINNVINELENGAKGIIPAVKISDTIKQSTNKLIDKTIDRSNLYSAQTPQGFDYQTIFELHKKHKNEEFTDDAALFEAENIAVKISEGNSNNFKITTNDDLKRAENMLNSGQTRIGMGYDVHAFETGDFITLCGIKIPFNRSLKGHSDADVALHALVDAMLGAIASGDIGSHFPPSDKKWKGANSELFVKHAADLIHKKGGKIINADITIICEKPKLGKYRDEMRKNIARILQTDISNISVKATTTEKLGFTGREEGIAANAVISLSL